METGHGQHAVLVADGNQGMRKMLASMLGHFGAKAVLATGADELPDLVERCQLETAFIDLDLARDEAAALAKKLRQRQPRMKVVIMYTYATRDEIGRLEKEGDLVLLPKPFELSRVRELVCPLSQQ
jgi:DNA-binding NtrC family response regulator